MKTLFRAYFHKQNFQNKVDRKFIRSGTGSGHFQKSDQVNYCPDPQHWLSQGL
jgi:hypothetical protein